ncbi:MAG TPA: hypothetical protein DDW90_00485 [Cyanobacteria bacterium UBA9971]|nr:hypothetical protein [Cyanobacteria bacterium UBA9971]
MKLARKANISKVAWEALIPVENKIMPKLIEHSRRLDNTGEILFQNDKGTKISVKTKHIKDFLIGTHNHPDEKHYSIDSYLSFADIRNAIRFNDIEKRAVTKDGFCHLVELPPLTTLDKLKCNLVLNQYEKMQKELIKYTINELQSESKEMCLVFINKAAWVLKRKMQKTLEKVAGLKFRTIKLPE